MSTPCSPVRSVRVPLVMTDSRPFGAYAPTGFPNGLSTAPAAQAGLGDAAAGAGLRHVATRFLGGAPVDIETFGARMRLYPYNNVCEKKALFTPQFFDPEEFDVLKDRIRDGFTFVDVGSNVGVYALFVAAQAGPHARILAVEPQPEVFDRLAYNIRQNPFGTVKAVACAVADKAGELTSVPRRP